MIPSQNTHWYNSGRGWTADPERALLGEVERVGLHDCITLGCSEEHACSVKWYLQRREEGEAMLKNTSLMGWCIAGQHGEACRTEYVDWIGQYRHCGCKCHPAVSDEHVAQFIIDNPVDPKNMPADLRKRASTPAPRTRTTKSAASKTAAPAPKARSTRNTAAEKKAATLVDAALTDVMADSSVVDAMNEMLED